MGENSWETCLLPCLYDLQTAWLFIFETYCVINTKQKLTWHISWRWKHCRCLAILSIHRGSVRCHRMTTLDPNLWGHPLQSLQSTCPAAQNLPTLTSVRSAVFLGWRSVFESTQSWRRWIVGGFLFSPQAGDERSHWLLHLQDIFIWLHLSPFYQKSWAAHSLQIHVN